MDDKRKGEGGKKEEKVEITKRRKRVAYGAL